MSSLLLIRCLRAALRRERFTLRTLAARHAGHSHWQNIRHIKGAKDAIKADKSAQLSLRIRQALAEPGGADVKLNSSLAKAVRFGEENNIPSKSIQGMIAKAWASQQSRQLQRIEARGPGGSFLILLVATDQLRKVQNIVNKTLVKHGGAVLSAGGCTTHFTDKGVVVVSPGDEALSMEEAEEIAIAVDAEDIDYVSDDGESATTYQITCDPLSLNAVVKNLADTKLTVDDFRVEPVPNLLVDLSDQDKAELETAINTIRNNSEVSLELVYDNIRWS